jgi:hypothetical protein
MSLLPGLIRFLVQRAKVFVLAYFQGMFFANGQVTGSAFLFLDLPVTKKWRWPSAGAILSLAPPTDDGKIPVPQV